MDLGAILLLLGLVVLVGIYVSKPLFEAASSGKKKDASFRRDDNGHISSLMAERDRLITALQELDFDQALGKVPDDEYQYQRAELVQRGVSVLKQLDDLQQVESSAYAGDRLEEAISRRKIEKSQKEIAQGLPANAVGAQDLGKSDDGIEDLISARRRNRSEKTAGFCPRCGHPAQKSDRFCSKCGTPLT